MIYPRIGFNNDVWRRNLVLLQSLEKASPRLVAELHQSP